MVTQKIKLKEYSKTHNKYPDLTIVSTRGLKYNSIGVRLHTGGYICCAAPQNFSHCDSSQGEEFWPPEFLTWILTVAFSLCIILHLKDCSVSPSLSCVSKLLASPVGLRSCVDKARKCVGRGWLGGDS